MAWQATGVKVPTSLSQIPPKSTQQYLTIAWLVNKFPLLQGFLRFMPVNTTKNHLNPVQNTPHYRTYRQCNTLYTEWCTTTKKTWSLSRRMFFRISNRCLFHTNWASQSGYYTSETVPVLGLKSQIRRVRATPLQFKLPENIRCVCLANNVMSDNSVGPK